jgi:short-subunit dehydrogenase
MVMNPSLKEKPSQRIPRLSFWQRTGYCAAALFTASQLVKYAKKVDLRGKTVLITGSRGLGLALAYELGRRGARIALSARDPEELQRACEGLHRESIEAVWFPCDVTHKNEIEQLLRQVIERFGRLDILVNNAGEIQVGPFDSLEHSDFERAMDLMFWAPLNLTFAVLPEMKRQGGGYIVNITSVGGRVSVPHLLPYSCAKFAFVGFSTGLSSELRGSGIDVLTVVPGLMRTGGHLNAKFKSSAQDEFAWFSLLGNLPGMSVAAGYAARCIRRALERKMRVCTISLPAKILIACEALLPDTMRTVMASTNRFLLPRDNGSKQEVTGHSLEPLFGRSFQVATALGKQAADALNERAGS